jgi:hypothetical protein
MAGWTNRFKYKIFDWVMRAATLPTNFYVALFTSATAPTADINTKSELTEIANGDGYTTGGYQLSRNATDFDVLTEDDANDKALVQIKDLVWTATGGDIPASGSGARYACLTDDNATQGSRLILTFWDLVSNRVVSVGQSLTLQNCEVDLTE